MAAKKATKKLKKAKKLETTKPLSLNFSKVSWKYGALDAKTSGTPDVVGWDLTQQKKM